MATPVALQAPCIAIYSGILSAGNSSIGTLFSNQGVGQIWVATMGHFSVAISKVLWILTNPHTGSLLQPFLLSKQFLLIKRHLITHDII